MWSVVKFGIVVASIFAVTFVAIVIITRREQGFLQRSLSRAKEFASWSAETWQTLVQVGQRSASAPSVLRAFYLYITVLELDTTVVLSPQCYTSYPFGKEAMQLFGSLLLCGLVATVLVLEGRVDPTLRFTRKVLLVCGKAGMTLLILLYPLIANTSLTLVSCKAGTVLQGIDFYGQPIVKRASVLRSNPGFQCYTGDHLPVGVMSWFALLSHTFAFPIVTFVYLHTKSSHAAVLSEQWKDLWSPFLRGELRENKFWVTHANFVVLFVLAVNIAFANGPNAESQVAAFVSTVVISLLQIALLIKLDPYTADSRWKRPATIGMLCVTVSSALGVLLEYYDSKRPGTVAWAFVVFVQCMVMIAVFLYAFWRSIASGAQKDAAAAKKVGIPAAAPQASASQASGSGGTGNGGSNVSIGTIVNPMHASSTPAAAPAPTPVVPWGQHASILQPPPSTQTMLFVGSQYNQQSSTLPNTQNPIFRAAVPSMPK